MFTMSKERTSQLNLREAEELGIESGRGDLWRDVRYHGDVSNTIKQVF